MELGCPVGFVNVHMFLQQVHSLRPWKSSLKLSKVLDKRKNFLLAVPLSSSYFLSCVFSSLLAWISSRAADLIFPRVYTLKDNLRHGLQMI